MQTGQQARQPRPNRAFWPGAGRGDILNQISKVLMRAGAVVVLTGGAAMGKTRLAFEAAARVEAAAIRCRTITGDQCADPTAIIDEMALPPQPNSTGTKDTKARGLLVVDQAECAGAHTLEHLILIAEQTSIAVMLIGRAELVGMLVRSVPEQVCDVITRYVALEPLNAIQTAEFVMHCLGGDASREETSLVTCGDDAFRRILAHSRGVPGEIDRLMTDALRLAKLSRSARLTATVIDMIADDEDPPSEQPLPRQEPLAELPAQVFQRQAKPVATAQPGSQQPAILTRSMQTILTDLQERPDAAPGDDGGEDVGQYGGQDDSTIPEWPNSSPKPGHPPVRPTRRVPPWAGGVAFVVVATSAIALQHYLQSGAPVLALTDRPRAVVSSVVGDTMMHPAVPSDKPAPAPVEPVSSATEPPPALAAVMADKPMVQVAIVESPMLSPPVNYDETDPHDAQATVPEAAPDLPAIEALPEPPAIEALPEPPAIEALPELPAIEALPEPPTLSEEPVTEPTAETAPDVELSHPEPAVTAQPEPEPPAAATDAMAPVESEEATPELPPSPEPTAQVPPEPEPPAPSVEALSPSEPEAAPVGPPSLPEPTAEKSTPEPEPPAPSAEALPPVEPEAAPVEEPSLPEPTAAESPPEQAPADTATEMAPSDADEPPVPETLPPESPAAELSPPEEPAPLEPPAAVAVPEAAPPQEPAPEQASPPESEPEPTVAEPSPPPEPVAEPPAPEPAVVTAAPPPSPPPPAPRCTKAAFRCGVGPAGEG